MELIGKPRKGQLQEGKTMNALEKKTVKVDTTEKDYVIFQDTIGNELAIVTIERLDNGNIYALNIKGTTVRVSVSV